MKNAQFLYAACAAAMLAATPLYAQTNTQTQSTGPSNTVNAPTSGGTNPTGSSSVAGVQSKDSMAPKMDMSSGSTMHANKSESTMRHSSASAHPMMHAHKSDASQDAAVDKLNEQSFEAAQKGQSFNAGEPASGSGGSMNNGGQADGTGHSKM